MSGLVVLLVVVLLVLLFPVFWLISQSLRYYRLLSRGFSVAREGRDNIVYEERRNGKNRRLIIYGELMVRAPHVVYVPTEEEWESKMPEWARDRRTEIIDNVKRGLGTKNYEYE